MASVATASVGERMPPSTNPTANEIPITACEKNATAIDVKTTRPIASEKIGRRKRMKER